MKSHVLISYGLLLLSLLLLMPSANSRTILSLSDSKAIYSPESEEVQEQDVELLQAYLNNNNELKEINISFAYNQNSKGAMEKVFSRELIAKKIAINMDSCQIGHAGIDIILSKINKEHLEELSLNFNAVENATKAFSNIATAVSSYQHLKTLALELQFLELTEQNLKVLFSHPLPAKIQSLTLDLTLNKLNSQSFISLQQYLSRTDAKTLKHMKIILGMNKIDEKGVRLICEALKKYSQLQTLQLDLFFNQAKTKGSKHISDLIQQLKHLKDLSINLELNYIQKQGGIAIGQALSHLPSLKQLQICVNNKNFGFNGYEPIIINISQMNRLQKLILKAGINRLGLNGAEKTAEALQKLPLLKYLELNFVENYIQDDGLWIITKAIKQLRNLEELTLNVGFNEIKNGEQLVKLFEVLEQSKIQTLWIGLSNNALGDQSIQKIIPFVQRILSTKKVFKLEIFQTKITNSLLKLLRKIFIQKGSEDHEIYINSEEGQAEIREVMEKETAQRSRDPLQTEL